MKRNCYSLLIFLFLSGVNFAQTQKFPVYKGCEGKPSSELEDCFNQTVKSDVLRNFDVPEVMVTDNFEGTVNVLFFVTKKGEFQVVHVNSPYPELEVEIKKTFKELSNAKAAQFNGHAVEMSFSMPLHFPDPKKSREEVNKENEDEKVTFSKPVEKKELTPGRKSVVLEHQSNLNIPLNYSRYVNIERDYIQGENVHTSVKPYTYNKVLEYVDLDAQKMQFLKKNHLGWVEKFGMNIWFS